MLQQRVTVPGTGRARWRACKNMGDSSASSSSTHTAFPTPPTPPPAAPPAPAPKRAFTNPFHQFAREQRPLLPAGLNNIEREKRLGQMWRALGEGGRLAYESGLTKVSLAG